MAFGHAARRSAIVFASATLLATEARASETRPIWGPHENARLHLELPMFEAPFNVFAGGAYPSAMQATWATADLYELAHFGIGRIWSPFGDDAALGITALSAFDTLTFLVATPLGSAWNHEEWHRAVLTRARVPSTNPLSTGVGFPLFDPIALEVDPAAETTFKAQRPRDYAHVSVAGFQSHYQLAHLLERNAFYEDQPTLSVFAVGLNYLLPPVYHLQCVSGGVVNGDCSIFVRQLYAPTEAPTERALTSNEQSYATMVLGLSMLNLLDPFLLGIRAFETRREDGLLLRWNAAVRAIPTPFGQDVRLDGFLKVREHGFFVSIHNAFNRRSYFPALDTEWRTPLGRAVDVSLRVGAWLQPKDQSSVEAAPRAGGRVGLRLSLPIASRTVLPYVDAEGKTPGWVLGNPFLDANITATAGVALNVF